MRVLFDSVNASKIPSNAAMVAGYVDGLYKWTDADWTLFPNAVHVPIAVLAETNDGVVLDVEPGNARPDQAPGWVEMRRKAGVDPTVYCSISGWQKLKQQFLNQHVPEPHWWIAHYRSGADIPAGAIALQYEAGKDYDTSSVLDYWPGVDKPAGENHLTPLPTAAKPPVRKVPGTGTEQTVSREVLATLKMEVSGDAFYIPLPIEPVGNYTNIRLQVDTGAFMNLISKTTADALGYTSQGTQQYVGVDGVTHSGELTTIRVLLDGKEYDMPAIVDASWSSTAMSDGLFGTRSWIADKMGLDFDPESSNLTVYIAPETTAQSGSVKQTAPDVQSIKSALSAASSDALDFANKLKGVVLELS